MADATVESAVQAAIGAGKVNGAILCAADNQGFTFEKAIGDRTLLSGEKKAHQPDDVLFLGSATKLIATIAALQCVDDGLLSLDGELSTFAPELAAKKVLTGFSDDGEPILVPQEQAITLRMLLTHTSGVTYFFLDPLVGQWRQKNPSKATAENKLPVEEFCDTPLSFQPGKGWLYGPGIDWAGRIVERATGKTLGGFLRERLFGPLDIKDGKFFPATENEDLKDRLVDLTPDDLEAVGKAVVGSGPDMNSRGKGDFGGHGLFMTAPGYLAVLQSLLANDGKILKPETVNAMFGESHLTPESEADLKQKLAGPAGVFFRVGTAPESAAGLGLGGLLTLEDVEGWYGKGTLTWGGGMTFAWFVDRKNGICGVGAILSKVPIDIPAVSELKQVFRKDVYRKWEEWKQQR
jgi:CubicO group peptidase (beta-lactamase class C family)